MDAKFAYNRDAIQTGAAILEVLGRVGIPQDNARTAGWQRSWSLMCVDMLSPKFPVQKVLASFVF